jgi:hypothetical protein
LIQLKPLWSKGFLVAHPTGFEPVTSAFGGPWSACSSCAFPLGGLGISWLTTAATGLASAAGGVVSLRLRGGGLVGSGLTLSSIRLVFCRLFPSALLLVGPLPLGALALDLPGDAVCEATHGAGVPARADLGDVRVASRLWLCIVQWP